MLRLSGIQDKEFYKTPCSGAWSCPYTLLTHRWQQSGFDAKLMEALCEVDCVTVTPLFLMMLYAVVSSAYIIQLMSGFRSLIKALHNNGPMIVPWGALILGLWYSLSAFADETFPHLNKSWCNTKVQKLSQSIVRQHSVKCLTENKQQGLNCNGVFFIQIVGNVCGES